VQREALVRLSVHGAVWQCGVIALMQRTPTKKSPVGWAASLVLLMASSAPAQLSNGGFEAGGGSLDSWSTFNNVIPNVLASTLTPLTGTHVAKVFGGFNGNPNYSGLLQNLPAGPGEFWEASCHARHNTGDALSGTDNHLLLKIEFYRVVGGTYGTSDMLLETGIIVLDAGSPLDTWTHHALQVIAPSETVEARIALVFVQEDSAPGAALIDDVAFSASVQDDPPTTGWSLVWQDEFDGAGVDPSKWRVEDLHLNKNNELQYYAPDEVYLQDGNLVLRSQERSYWGYDDDGYWRHFDYTSGLVESAGRFSTTYGRIEVCAKPPGTQGIWPAHWMLPTSGAWPPEIDIMELLGHQPNTVHMSQHWGTWPDVQSFTTSFTGPDYTQDFHVFAVEWWPDRIMWFVDDVAHAAHFDSIPQEPFYIILNTAVGGTWPGNPDGSTVFPQYHEIDYVRVYAPDTGGSAYVEFEDNTPGTAHADGVIDESEYCCSTTGINSGFADRIGETSLFFVDSGSDGRLHFAFEATAAWPMPGDFGVVIYLDTAPGGYGSTAALADVADSGRRMASGKGASGQQADLYFAPGFRADYAICLEPEAATIYQLGETSHTLINGAALGSETDILGGNEAAYHIDEGSSGLRIRELELRLEHIGVEQGESFMFVATMLSSSTAFRTNEFIGVATGNAWDAGNLGQSSAALKVADFIRFQSAPLYGDIDADGVVDMTDVELFVAALLGIPQDPAHLQRADLDGVGGANGEDVAAFILLALPNM
jgi:beta-glucanase (GH16 family)